MLGFLFFLFLDSREIAIKVCLFFGLTSQQEGIEK